MRAVHVDVGVDVSADENPGLAVPVDNPHCFDCRTDSVAQGH